MRILELIRLEETRQGTIGILKIDKEVFCFTLEPTDRLNERNRSSIPAQQYICHPHVSQKFGETWMIEDVPGRYAVLFHAGNTAEDTEGCILLGSTVGKLKGKRAVLNSGYTFNEFKMRLANDTVAHLTIQTLY
jgi:hypothetical protein